MDTLRHLYWGKLGSDGQWHHLCHHCLDVAACVDVLLDSNPRWAKELYTLSPYSEEETRKLVLFFAAIHDIGKFCDAFQLQECAKNCIPQLDRKLKNAEKYHHTVLGLYLFREIYGEIEQFIPNEDALKPLITASFCHHGAPVNEPFMSKPCKNDVLQDVKMFVCCIADFFALQEIEEIHFIDNDLTDEDIFRLMSWLCAGLFILADWLGSNETFFPKNCQWQGPESYYSKALIQARKAVTKLHLGEFVSGTTPDFHTIVPNLPTNATPSPMQDAMLSLPELSSQELIIIEDLTGAGKTEAALIALNRLLRGGQGSGVYIALPTMATANAMYGRMSATYRSIFSDAHASLLLAHGNTELNDAYQDSILTYEDETAVTGEGHSFDEILGIDERDNSAAYCSQWLTDSRKKALLAPCGVGTIDQALLAITMAKHQALRLFGLSRSVLIVDEVHAFDSYTGALIQNCLRFHAALGGSAILLSATLPEALRVDFVKAWADGLAAKKCFHRALAKSVPQNDATLHDDMSQATLPSLKDHGSSYAPFPLYTRVFSHSSPQLASNFVIEETSVASARSLHVAVKPVFIEAAMFDALHDAYNQGACAVWVRNTVGDVCDAYTKLIESGIVPPENIHVFHARFCGADRDRIENAVLSMFGKASMPSSRAGHILLASQVVEQSLDLDFDILLSDLAPIDVLIQRAGRCHRHERSRPVGYEQSCMQVYMPDPHENLTESWYKSVFPHAAYVYERTASLWCTAKLLCDAKALVLPQQARHLIESVYGGMDYPDAFLAIECKIDGKDNGKTAMAKYIGLELLSGYVGDDWLSDISVPTRLGDNSADIRMLCVQDDGTLSLLGAQKSSFSMQDCKRAQLRVRASIIHEADNPAHYADVLAACMAAMPDKGKWCVCLVLQKSAESDNAWHARAIKQNGQAALVRYSAKFGLSVE